MGPGRRVGRKLNSARGCHESAGKCDDKVRSNACERCRRYLMKLRFSHPRASVAILALAISAASARAEVAMPLASHRAAYEISLSDTDSSRPPSGQTPIAASGLIAYEFRGSACEGYASNFRQLTELQRNEGNPISSDIRALTFEDGGGKSLTFQIDSQSLGDARAADRRLGRARRRGRHHDQAHETDGAKDRHRQGRAFPHAARRADHRQGPGGRRHDGSARL